MITGSALERIELCPASAVLPQADTVTDAATRGSEIHAFVANVADKGYERALESAGDELESACRGLDLDALPPLDRMTPEVAYAYDPATGAARALGSNIDRR